MQFITTGNRIAIENFTIGDLYTVTFTNGNFINSACIGIGANFVTFQRNEPELLFSLTMETAELVSTIDLYAGGSGTNNYNELTNKPQINSIELVGNKSLAAFGIQSEITEESPLSSALVSGLGSAAAAETSDFATAAQGALAASAVQPATMDAALALKQDALSSAQLDAVNSGITSTDVSQISINENNISYNTNMGVKNLSPTNAGSATRRIAIPLALTAGTYTVYIGSITSTDTDNTQCQIVAMIGSTVISDYLKVPRITGGAYTFNVSSTSDNVYIYASDSYAHSDGDTVTISDFMICKKAIYDADPTYQPYALSNAELTAATNQTTPTVISSISTALDDISSNSIVCGFVGSSSTIPNISNEYVVARTYRTDSSLDRRIQIVEGANGGRATRLYNGTSWGAWS